RFKPYGLSFRGKNAVFPLTLGRAAPCRRLRVSPFSKLKRSRITGKNFFLPSHAASAAAKAALFLWERGLLFPSRSLKKSPAFMVEAMKAGKDGAPPSQRHA
ncbi:hypothetical protein QUW15_14150, partial [Desulfovibrio piger]|nr:hypothetical protein [Desulfovibrio piger]